MTTTLQKLLAELDAAPAGRLDDVRRWVRTLAMEMMQMQRQWVTATASSCRDNGSGVCTSCNTVHMMPSYSMSIASPSVNEASTRGELERLRLFTERVVRESDDARESIVKIVAERDAARAEVDRLSREHSQALADRDRAFRTEVERLMKELGEAITQRDELREAIDRESTAVERLTRERDRAQDGLLAVSQERNRIERETVEAIAKALEDYKFDSAEFVRDGHWKNADYWRTR